MIRKLVTACAAVLISGSAAFAADASGTFSGNSDGQEIHVTLQESNSSVHGSVKFMDSELILEGRDENGQVSGNWTSRDGQQHSFEAKIESDELRLSTNGVNYSLHREGQNPLVQEPVEHSVPGSDDLASLANAPMVNGKIFAIAVPQGWQRTESSNESFAVSPDRMMAYGAGGLEGIPACTPGQFIEMVQTKAYNATNLKFVSQEKIASPEGVDGLQAIVTYDLGNQHVKSWVQAMVRKTELGTCGYMMIVSTSPDKFNAVAPTLKTLVNKTRVINMAEAFGRDKRKAQQEAAGKIDGDYARRQKEMQRQYEQYEEVIKGDRYADQTGKDSSAPLQ